MGKQKEVKKVSRKKEIRDMINTKLEVALSDFKNVMDEKKYNSALKKGSKLLSRLLFVKKKKEKKAEIEELSA